MAEAWRVDVCNAGCRVKPVYVETPKSWCDGGSRELVAVVVVGVEEEFI